jgi:hypothetical protein
VIPGEIAAGGAEAIALFETLIPLSPEESGLVAGQPERDALVQELLLAASNDHSTIAFADRVVRLVLQLYDVEMLVTMICTPEFLNQPNFPCVFHIFKLFEQRLQGGDFPEFVEFCSVFHDPARGNFDDSTRRPIFAAMGKPETVATLLHGD